jgi:putative membrane protein
MRLMQFTLIFHILGVVLWVGGLLMLSRIMVLHAKDPGPGGATFSLVERKVDLFALIGLLLVAASGLYQLLVLWPPGMFRQSHWMHVKITVVLVLFVLHGLLLRTRLAWQRLPSGTALSKGVPLFAHAVIGLGLCAILVLVYLRPF